MCFSSFNLQYVLRRVAGRGEDERAGGKGRGEGRSGRREEEWGKEHRRGHKRVVEM